MSQVHVAHPPERVEFEVYARSDFSADQFQSLVQASIQSSQVSDGMGHFKLSFPGDVASALGLVWLHNLVLTQPNVLSATMMSVKNRVSSVTVPPDNRKYLHEQEDLKLRCDCCECEVKISELESDSHDEGGYSNKVCPNCGAWDCVDWESETLSDEELAKIANDNLGPAGPDGN